jgi:hypothetical protein
VIRGRLLEIITPWCVSVVLRLRLCRVESKLSIVFDWGSGLAAGDAHSCYTLADVLIKS